jgi:hypothetical protein
MQNYDEDKTFAIVTFPKDNFPGAGFIVDVLIAKGTNSCVLFNCLSCSSLVMPKGKKETSPANLICSFGDQNDNIHYCDYRPCIDRFDWRVI